MYPHASPSPSSFRSKTFPFCRANEAGLQGVFASVAFPYIQSIPAPTDKNSPTLNAIVGLTTIVWRSIFVIWFRKMLVSLSLYSCPSPNGEKMPTP